MHQWKALYTCMHGPGKGVKYSRRNRLWHRHRVRVGFRYTIRHLCTIPGVRCTSNGRKRARFDRFGLGSYLAQYASVDSHPVDWSVGKAKKETTRDYKNYHGVADLLSTHKEDKDQKSLNQVSSNWWILNQREFELLPVSALVLSHTATPPASTARANTTVFDLPKRLKTVYRDGCIENRR